MNLAISHETETRLPARGADANARQLPVWHLGLCGSLHRRDIYEDVR